MIAVAHPYIESPCTRHVRQAVEQFAASDYLDLGPAELSELVRLAMLAELA